MLEVKVSLNRQEHIASMSITQTGPGASGGTHRNYTIVASYRTMADRNVIVFKHGIVWDHDRELPVWELIRKAIEGLAL